MDHLQSGLADLHGLAILLTHAQLIDRVPNPYSSLASTPTAFLPDSLIGPITNLRSIQLRFPLNRLRSESIRRATSLNIVLKPPYRRGSDPTYRYLVDLADRLYQL